MVNHPSRWITGGGAEKKKGEKEEETEKIHNDDWWPFARKVLLPESWRTCPAVWSPGELLLSTPRTLMCFKTCIFKKLSNKTMEDEVSYIAITKMNQKTIVLPSTVRPRERRWHSREKVSRNARHPLLTWSVINTDTTQNINVLM